MPPNGEPFNISVSGTPHAENAVNMKSIHNRYQNTCTMLAKKKKKDVRGPHKGSMVVRTVIQCPLFAEKVGVSREMKTHDDLTEHSCLLAHT